MSEDSATPARGQQVFSAVAVIHKQVDGINHILVARRADTKKFLPGKVELPGGHIDFGEHMTDGLKRELKEELGVEVNLGAPFAVFDYLNEVKGSHSIEVAYFAQLKTSEEDISLDPADHSEWFWVTQGTLRKVTDVNGTEDEELEILKEAFRLLSGHKVRVS